MKLIRFGKWNIYNPNLSYFGRIGYFIHGSPNLAQFFQSHYFRKCIKKIIRNKTQTVLDVGCGGGDYSFYLAEKYPFLKIDAIDISKEGIEMAKIVQEKSNIHNINFLPSDLEELPEKKKYSLVILINVINEVKDKREFIKKSLAFVEGGGVCFYSNTSLPWIL